MSVSLEGAKGTTPGPVLADDFQERLNEAWTAEGNAELEDYSYAAESYDAVVLLALASLAAGSTDAADIAAKLQEVSGGSGDGEKCTTFADCAEIIIGGGSRRLRRLLRWRRIRRRGRPDRGHDRHLPVRCRQHVRAHQLVTLTSQRGPRSRSGALRVAWLVAAEQVRRRRRCTCAATAAHAGTAGADSRRADADDRHPLFIACRGGATPRRSRACRGTGR